MSFLGGQQTNNRKNIRKSKGDDDWWDDEMASLKYQKQKQPKQCVNKISPTDWKTYFSELLNSSNVINEEHNDNVKEYMTWHDANCEQCQTKGENDILDKEFTIKEIEKIIKDLQKSKSPGLDGITNDILQNASMIVIPLLCELFNKMLQSGYYPESWGEAIIVPLHKKGNVNEPSNYRGIALLSSVSKIFTKMLNNRLVDWADKCNKMSELQAGFTRGKSTVDQIFVLQTLISKYLSRKKGRFYAVFVDFSKAFDTVPHLHLFYSLISGDIHGRLITILRNMYSKFYSCVQLNNKCVSDLFSCNIDTRQGCMLSPFMFIFYLNELAKLADLNSCKGIFIKENHSNIPMLLYADDLVILGDNLGNVQRL